MTATKPRANSSLSWCSTIQFSLGLVSQLWTKKSIANCRRHVTRRCNLQWFQQNVCNRFKSKVVLCAIVASPKKLRYKSQRRHVTRRNLPATCLVTPLRHKLQEKLHCVLFSNYGEFLWEQGKDSKIIQNALIVKDKCSTLKSLCTEVVVVLIVEIDRSQTGNGWKWNWTCFCFHVAKYPLISSVRKSGYLNHHVPGGSDDWNWNRHQFHFQYNWLLGSCGKPSWRILVHFGSRT